MDSAYFDSSAVLKRYLQEHGAIRARRLMRRYSTVSSVLTPLEVLSAMTRRQAAGEMDKTALELARENLKDDAKSWELIPVEELLLQRAETVILRSRLKTVDAVHLASALSVEGHRSQHLPFITADQRQAAAARAHGLEVIAV